MTARHPRIVTICGSLRRDSINRRALAIAARGAAEAGAEIDATDPHDILFPLYNQDDEDASGIPDEVLAFRERLKAADGLLIACPEYNGSITAALKNAIDWASRPREGEAPLACFRGKTGGLVAASPGKLGGIRGMPETRRILSGIGVHMIAVDFALSAADKALEGPDEQAVEGFRRVGRTLVEITTAIINHPR